ncbi:zinc finger protein 804B [Spea bombifrons]|uniref:zinc finger protein 804B n=1 Tax=Spea bombifrons TaxID=233779 RepID=UPI002349EAAF|nr:zinc finger protein 804B [Spea bombifrons]
MACYYLVISSTHLSNGHFRSIKGVFRGPLRKSGTTLQGYAEKGKSIANALEDLKANFYCELCDKQYHKHHEFDNHINSYDHAHKQRLKELKQREFARNVASKSWKDEKKQERALKRLHQLAELRKQPDCVSDEGPIFKTPRLRGPQGSFFTRKDERLTGSRCTVLCKGEPVTSSSITENKQDILFGRDVLKNSRCCFVGNQTQLPFSNISNVNNRASISFCFSKKALLKLDSSASVFNESTEDVNECNQLLNNKAKQMSVSFRHYAHLDENATEDSTLTDQHKASTGIHDDVPANMETFMDSESCSRIEKPQSEIQQSDETVELHSSDVSCKDILKQTETDDCPRLDITSATSETVQSQEETSVPDKWPNKHTVADAILIEQLSQLLSQKHSESEPSSSSNTEKLDDTDKVPKENPEKASSEAMNNNNVQTKALSCLNVLSKDGTTNLKWPTELVLYTKTEPSISYACNPLYFDFKCSPKSKCTKINERVTNSYEEHEKWNNKNGGKNSTITVDKAMENGKDSHSDAKREKYSLMEGGSESFNNYRLTKEFTQKATLRNSAQTSAHHNASQTCIVQESNHSRKRKRSFRGHPDKSRVCHGHNKNNSISKDDSKSEHRKCLNYNQLNWIDSGDLTNLGSSHKNQCRNHNEKCHCEHSFSSQDFGRCSDSESDMSSVSYRGSSYSQMSSSSSDSMQSDSSDSSERSKCKHGYHHKSRKCFRKREDCIPDKYKVLSESDFISDTSDTKQKCRSRNLDLSRKHNILRSSKYFINEHQPRKKCKSSESDNVKETLCLNQVSSCEDINPTSNSVGALSKERTYTVASETSVPNQVSFMESETNEASYKCYSENMVSVPGNCRGDNSENIVKHIIVNERKTLIAELHLEHGTQAEEKEIPSRDYSEDCSMKLNDHSERYFPVEFPQSKASNESSDKQDTVDTVINKIDNSDEAPTFKVTVTKNNDHCVFEDVIHMGNGCQTQNYEGPVPVGEQSRQLISEVQPLMQSSDPVHLKLSCGLPFLRHSGGTDLPETKEEHKRLRLHNVNKKPSPVEGNGKFHYDSTMQDFNKTDSNQRVIYKSASPSLAQQPVTFSPDEVDKYRLLQLQAQQHMQKQLLSKHFKALPTNGPSVFSTAQAIQPVSVQQHPSVTTIHHAVMQRYAVTASMQSQVNHIPLPHLNPIPQAQFSPVALSSITPTLFPAHPALLTGHPLHLVSATAIHPSHLTIHTIPHTAFIPAIFTPHPSTGIHPAVQLHPFIHPLFPGHDFHIHSRPSHPH